MSCSAGQVRYLKDSGGNPPFVISNSTGERIALKACQKVTIENCTSKSSSYVDVAIDGSGAQDNRINENVSNTAIGLTAQEVASGIGALGTLIGTFNGGGGSEVPPPAKQPAKEPQPTAPAAPAPVKSIPVKPIVDDKSDSDLPIPDSVILEPTEHSTPAAAPKKIDSYRIARDFLTANGSQCGAAPISANTAAQKGPTNALPKAAPGAAKTPATGVIDYR